MPTEEILGALTPVAPGSLERRQGGRLRRIQKLRCGWLLLNRRLAQMDLCCDSGCWARSSSSSLQLCSTPT